MSLSGHGTLAGKSGMRAIGVDVHTFAPVSYTEVKVIMAKKSWRSPIADDDR